MNNVHHTEDEASTTRMTARARSYTLIDGILYKKRVVQPLLKCIGPRALSVKAIRQGFYWPTHIKNVEEIIKTCQACQSTSPH